MVTMVHPDLPGREQVVTERRAAVLEKSGWTKKNLRKKKSEVSPPEASEVPQLGGEEDTDKENSPWVV